MQFDFHYDIRIAGFPVSKHEFPCDRNTPSIRVIALWEIFPCQVAPVRLFLLTNRDCSTVTVVDRARSSDGAD